MRKTRLTILAALLSAVAVTAPVILGTAADDVVEAGRKGSSTTHSPGPDDNETQMRGHYWAAESVRPEGSDDGAQMRGHYWS